MKNKRINRNFALHGYIQLSSTSCWIILERKGPDAGPHMETIPYCMAMSSNLHNQHKWYRSYSTKYLLQLKKLTTFFLKKRNTTVSLKATRFA